jgi:hypothetical protein
MRFRHALIPYLYTCAWRDHKDGILLCRPPYHLHPEKEEAYLFRNSYFFGSELYVAPFTTPIDKEIGFARQVVWLPENYREVQGEKKEVGWYMVDTKSLIDTEHGSSMFTILQNFTRVRKTTHYKGGTSYSIYGKAEDIPVFVKAGAILPLTLPSAGVDELPQHLAVHVFAGNDNSFTMYEDDGLSTEYQRGVSLQTVFSVEYEDNKVTFAIKPSAVPEKWREIQRTFSIHFHSVGESAEVLSTSHDNLNLNYVPTYERLVVKLDTKLDEEVKFTLATSKPTEKTVLARTLERCQEVITGFNLRADNQEDFITLLSLSTSVASLVEVLSKFCSILSPLQRRTILEVATNCGAEVLTGDEGSAIVLWNNDADEAVEEDGNFRQDHPHLYNFAGEGGNIWSMSPAEKYFLERGEIKSSIMSLKDRRGWTLGLRYFGGKHRLLVEISAKSPI